MKDQTIQDAVEAWASDFAEAIFENGRKSAMDEYIPKLMGIILDGIFKFLSGKETH